MPKTHLFLFMTRGMSLEIWERVGLLTRETRLYQALQETGIRVSIVSYGTREARLAARLPEIDILFNRWGLPLRLYERCLLHIHKDELAKASLFKTNQILGSRVAVQAARTWQTPLIVRCGYLPSDFSIRTFGPNSRRARRALKLEREVFSAAQRCVVTTAAARQDLESRISGASIEVIPNYVDTELFRPQKKEKEFDLVFVGRNTPQKNLPALLEAVSSSGVSLLLIGGMHRAAGIQRAFPGQKIKCPGTVPNAELPRYLNRSRVFVLPSLFEGNPKALLEAMSCGLPVIASRVPGIENLLVHKETGFLCDPSPQSIRSAIDEVLASPRLQERMGDQARSTVISQCSIEAVVEREIQLYEDLLARNGTNL